MWMNVRHIVVLECGVGFPGSARQAGVQLQDSAVIFFFPLFAASLQNLGHKDAEKRLFGEQTR